MTIDQESTETVEQSAPVSGQEDLAKLHEQTGGMAGEAPTTASAAESDLGQATGGAAGPANAGSLADMLAPYKGNVLAYICAGGVIGLCAGWLIALAADINGWGGVIAGAIAGAAIGLYVVETKRF